MMRMQKMISNSGSGVPHPYVPSDLVLPDYVPLVLTQSTILVGYLIPSVLVVLLIWILFRDELGRFVAEKRCLSSLKVEGCSSLGSFTLSSSSLSTLWLSDIYRLFKMVFNCPNLKEISLDFSRQENDSTDLATMVDSLGRTCQKLENIHIASIRLSHYVVLALTAANLRSLCMLSFVLGSEITDASFVAIASGYPDLKLLDLNGSSISDSGIGMICNELTKTLSRLLLALMS